MAEGAAAGAEEAGGFGDVALAVLQGLRDQEALDGFEGAVLAGEGETQGAEGGGSPGGGGGGTPMGPPMELTPVSTPTRNTTTQYVYDGSRMIALKDHDGNTTTYAYDAAGRVETITYPPCTATSQPSDDGPCQVTFDWYSGFHGNFKRTDQRGIRTDYEFDDLGHLSRRVYGGAVPVREELFSFDRSGRLTYAKRKRGWPEDFEWGRTYDKLGRPVTELQKLAYNSQYNVRSYTTQFNYAIDEEAATTAWTMTMPGGRQVVHVLDRLNRLVEASAGSGIGVNWTHNAAGQRVEALRRNSAENPTTYGYDENGRLTQVSHFQTPILPFWSFGYGYDAVGNRLYTDNQGLPERSERYGYDNLNRLTVMERGELNVDNSAVVTPLSHPTLASNQQWADLDRRGNWLDYRWADSPAGTPVPHQQTRTANGVNEYTALDPDGPDPEGGPPNEPALTPTYDAAGNLTLDPLAPFVGGTGPSGQRYVHDEENRVIEIIRDADGATAAKYEYDALGRRVHTLDQFNAAGQPQRKTRHVYVGIETIQEYECMGQTACEAEDYHLLHEFLWGDPNRFPEPVAMVRHCDIQPYPPPDPPLPEIEEVFHYLHDVLGSVVGLTDSTGALVERYTYDPYGKPLIESWDSANSQFATRNSSLLGNPWLWTGQRYDAATGLYAFLFRTYSPSLGRWLQRDPAGYVGGLSLYEYVSGAPLVARDPFGLWDDGCGARRKALCQAKKRLEAKCRKMGQSMDAEAKAITEAAKEVNRLEAELADCTADKGEGNDEHRGHSDMPGGDEMDYTKEDYGDTAPRKGKSRQRHFRQMGDVIPDVEKAISKCDSDAFERSMHQGQDFFSHTGAGVTPSSHFWAKVNPWGDNPDNPKTHAGAFNQACQWTQKWWDKWNANCEKGPDGQWRKRQKADPKTPPGKSGGDEGAGSGGC